MTCWDSPTYANTFDSACDYSGIDHAMIGADPEPADMLLLPQNLVTREVAHDIAGTSQTEAMSYMWPEGVPNSVLTNEYYSRTTIGAYYLYSARNNGSFFVSALPNGTTTGVLREHAIRLNSSVSCEHVTPEEFPTTCPGSLPFVTKFEQAENTTVSICVPGNFTEHPWTLNRDRQDISEELYIDFSFVPSFDVDADGTGSNYTLHCTMATTRGYFELGNYRNNFTPGPLIDQWPSPLEETEDWNDYLGGNNGYEIPTER